MIKYVIKADKEIFDNWIQIEEEMKELKSIVQNDIEVDSFELKKFAARSEIIRQKIKQLTGQTVLHAMKKKIKSM